MPTGVNRAWRVVLVGWVLTAALRPFASYAQDAGVPEPDALEASSREPSHETVVRARQPERSASEVVVPQEILKATPRTSSTDVLRLVPGLVASQHSGGGKAHQLFLRGFDAAHGQDVELNVAGLPVNEPSHIHALGYADTNFLIPEAIREIRVYEGAYRAWQSDFAIAGTVRFELGLPEDGVLLSGRLGQFGERRLLLGVRPAMGPSTFAALDLEQNGGFGPQRAHQRASFLSQLELPLTPGGQATLRAVVGSYAARFHAAGVLPEADVLSGQRGFFDAATTRQGGAASRHQALLGLTVRGGGATTTLELFGIASDLRLRHNFTGYRLDGRGDGQEQSHDALTLGARAGYVRHLLLGGHGFRLELGLGGRRDGVEQTQRRYREADATFWRDEIDAQLTQSSGFGHAELSTTFGRWAAFVGGRADALSFDVFDALAFEEKRSYDGQGYARAAFGVHWGLKAGLERRVGEALRLFLNYGDGFRSPQARSLADGERAPFVNVRGAEVGALYARERWSLQGSGFGTYVEDDVFFDHAVGTTVSTGATGRAGASLVALVRPNDAFVFMGSATYAHAAVLSRRTLLPYFAPLVGRLDAGYERPVSIGGARITPLAGVAFTFIGPRPLPFDERSRSVALVDLRAGLRYRALTLQLDMRNALDTRWRDGEFVYSSRFDPSAVASLVPARHFTAGYPRMASLTLEVQL